MVASESPSGRHASVLRWARDLGDEGRCRIYRVGERGQRTQVCCHPVVLGVHLQLKRLLLTPIETVVRCLFPVSKDKMAT